MIFRVSLEPSEGGWIVALSAMLLGCARRAGMKKKRGKTSRKQITAWLGAEKQKADDPSI
jgi:hypothetical protein